MIAKNRREVYEEVARRTGKDQKLVNFVIKQMESTLRDVMTKPEKYDVTEISLRFGKVAIGKLFLNLTEIEFQLEMLRQETTFFKSYHKMKQAQDLLNHFKINDYGSNPQG